MDDFGGGSDAYDGFQVDPNSLTDYGLPQWYGQTATPQSLIDAGITLDPNSRFGDYDLASLQKLGIGSGSNITGLDANSFLNIDNPSGDKTWFRQTMYNNDGTGWKAGTPEYVKDQDFKLGDALKIAAPILLNFIPGVGQSLAAMYGGGVGGTLGAGATLGGVNAAIQGGDIGKGALLGATGAGLSGLTKQFNPASKLGITNPTLGSIFNKGLQTSVMTGLRGGDVSKALGNTLLTSGLNWAGEQLGSSFSGDNNMNGGMSYGSDGRLSLGGYLENPQTFAPAASQRYDEFGMDNDWQQNLFGSSLDFGGQQSISPDGFSVPGNNQTNPLMDFFRQSLTKGGRQTMGAGLGDMAGSLLGMYQANRARRDMKDQIRGLSGMFGQNSSYAQALRNQLNRRDAAAGRRSQYGPREVELQAKLAEMGQRNAPALSQLYAGQQAQQAMMMRNLLQLGNQTGLFNGLGRMFGG